MDPVRASGADVGLLRNIENRGANMPNEQRKRGQDKNRHRQDRIAATKPSGTDGDKQSDASQHQVGQAQ